MGIAERKAQVELENVEYLKQEKKDPNAPKGPTSSYLFFCNGNRAAIKLQMPEATNKELLTEVGRQWKDLAEKKKEKYTNMASLDKARYVKEMEKYNASK